jgi:hypothetical protein
MLDSVKDSALDPRAQVGIRHKKRRRAEVALGTAPVSSLN